MSENVEANSHVVNANNFLAESGFHFICELKSDSLRDKTPNGVVQDWKIIEQWIGCEERELNQQDKDRIERAWKSYFAIGIAPSLELQPLFNNFRVQAKLEKWEIVSIPSVVRDVFDRLLATDEEIKEKKKAEQIRLMQLAEHHKRQQSINTERNVKQRMRVNLSRKNRIYAVTLAMWVFYVFFRTAGYHEVFGFELSRWSSDSFWLNLLLPPLAIFVGIYLNKWVQKGKK